MYSTNRTQSTKLISFLSGLVVISFVIEPAKAIDSSAYSIPESRIVAQSSAAISAFKRGENLYNATQYDAALEELERSLQQNSDFAAAWRLRGKTLFKLGRIKDAMNSIGKALGSNPHDPDTWATQGELSEEKGDYMLAITSYESALDYMPRERTRDRTEIAYARGVSMFKQGYKIQVENKSTILSEATKQYYTAAVLAYNDAILEAQGTSKEQLSRIWLGRGEVLRRLERYDEALESFQKTTQIDPDLAEGWFRRGRVLAAKAMINTLDFEARNQWQEVILFLDKAARLDPEYAEVWDQRGWALYAQGQYDMAIKSFKHATKGVRRNSWQLESDRLDPAKAWFGIAVSLYQLECYRQAEAVFQIAYNLNSHYPDIQKYQKDAKRQLEHQKSSPAICRNY
jgi:tetratricopeptide (TPR) repeat protein